LVELSCAAIFPPDPFPSIGVLGGAQHYLWTTGSISIDDGPDMLPPRARMICAGFRPLMIWNCVRSQAWPSKSSMMHSNGRVAS